MHASVFFRTNNNNKYVFSFNKKKIIYSHPLLEYFYYKDSLRDNKEDVSFDLPKEVLIDKVKYNDEINYYYSKYLMLKKAGFFEPINSKQYYNGKLSVNSIKYELSNLKSLVFEVTEGCNLKCDYCFYGDKYTQYDDRSSKNLPVDDAKAIIDYLVKYWLSDKNVFIKQERFIGFYGGEPLLNFNFIQEIVEYANKIKKETGLILRFNMTTNGTLINRYIDFLRNNKFSITISIDGNRDSNSYRKYHNEKETYNDVYNNIKYIRSNYPKFYKTNVILNAVLHDKNNYIDLQAFSKKEFDKYIIANVVNPLLVGNEFKYNNHTYDFNDKENIRCFLHSGEKTHYKAFLRNFSNYFFDTFIDLLYPNRKTTFHPTGTCIPFSRRMFVTANGKILPCESIAHKFALGVVNNAEVNLDLLEVSDFYNKKYSKIENSCKSCYKINFCNDCMFLHMQNNEKNYSCSRLHKREYDGFMNRHYGFFESHPNLFEEIIKDEGLNE